MKQKKASANPLYKRLRLLLTKSGVFYETYGQKQIIVHSGYLAGLIITPEGNYCKVQSALFGCQKKVSHGFSFCVNYSMESLFYKLYKFNILDLVGYSFCVALIPHDVRKQTLELMPCN